MHPIQQKILDFAKDNNLGKFSLREIASKIDEKSSPQKIKHHVEQLKKKGLIKVNKFKNSVETIRAGLNKATSLISIPILGAANCGEAMILTDGQSEGYLQVSKNLLNTTRDKNIFALKAVGHSMNMCKVGSQKQSIEDGDYVIIDNRAFVPKNGDIVVSVMDGCANIKRLIVDKDNHQIVLLSESSLDFPPIHIGMAEDSDYMVNGKVVQVIKKPKI